MRWLLALAIGIPLLLAAFGLWAWAFVLYPEEHDPKNMRYVLWKHDLASVDLDEATSAIAEDPEGKNNLILGKTPQQLRARFGFLLTPHQAGPVLERCAHDSWAAEGEALYIRRTNLVVVFKNGVAIQTGLLKPC